MLRFVQKLTNITYIFEQTGNSKSFAVVKNKTNESREPPCPVLQFANYNMPKHSVVNSVITKQIKESFYFIKFIKKYSFI